jgi:hypothetical protein
MIVAFDDNGWEDYISRATDNKTLTRINRLIEEAARDPSSGTGNRNGCGATCPATGRDGSTRLMRSIP